MRGQSEHVVYVSVGGGSRQVTFQLVCCHARNEICADPVRVQRFGENKLGKMALAALGMTLVVCLVFSAATEVSTALLLALLI